MTTALIYSGFLRSWEQVKDNHAAFLWADHSIFFYTHEKTEGKHLLMKENLTVYPIAVDGNRAGETSVINTLNQWRNRRDAFSKVPGFDTYIISRTDIRFSGFIEVQNEPGKVFIPNGCDHREGVNDQFAFGGHDEMKVYCSLFDHYRKYFNQGLLFHPETYLKHHLESSGIEIIRIPQTNEIVR